MEILGNESLLSWKILHTSQNVKQPHSLSILCGAWIKFTSYQVWTSSWWWEASFEIWTKPSQTPCCRATASRFPYRATCKIPWISMEAPCSSPATATQLNGKKVNWGIFMLDHLSQSVCVSVWMQCWSRVIAQLPCQKENTRWSCWNGCSFKV